jgi:hypothetical protein
MPSVGSPSTSGADGRRSFHIIVPGNGAVRFTPDPDVYQIYVIKDILPRAQVSCDSICRAADRREGALAAMFPGSLTRNS